MFFSSEIPHIEINRLIKMDVSFNYRRHLSIVQWNARGIRNNGIDFFNFLKLKNQFEEPDVIALQESFLHSHSHQIPAIFSIPANYSIETVNKRFNSDLKARGGVSILVNNNYHSNYEIISLNTPLEAIAITLRQPPPNDKILLTICSLYLPSFSSPSSSSSSSSVLYSPTSNNLTDLIKQLPRPFIVSCDANAHSKLWNLDAVDTCQHGRIIESWLNVEPNICLINEPNVPTYKAVRVGKCITSTIDLSFVSSDIVADVEWDIERENTCGSDHFPIFLQYQLPSKQFHYHRHFLSTTLVGSNTIVPDSNTTSFHPSPSKWNLKKANWALYKNLSSNSVHLQRISNYDQFIIFLNHIAVQSIPKKCSLQTSSSLNSCRDGRLRDEPWNKWWTPELTDLKYLRDRALKEVRRSKCDAQKVQELNRLKGLFLKRKREIEEDYWQNFADSIDFRTSPSNAWKTVKCLKSKTFFQGKVLILKSYVLRKYE